MNRVIADGRDLLLTGDHPVLTANGQRPAAAISVHDRLMIGGRWLSVTANELVTPADGQEVWNVELDADEQEANHWIEANGIVVGDLWMQERLNQ